MYIKYLINKVGTSFYRLSIPDVIGLHKENITKYGKPSKNIKISTPIITIGVGFSFFIFILALQVGRYCKCNRSMDYLTNKLTLN